MKISHLVAIGAIVIIAAGCSKSSTPGSVQTSTASGKASAAGISVDSAILVIDTQPIDVTRRVSDLLQSQGQFRARPRPLGTEPVPGKKGQLTIVFEYKGKRHTFTTEQGSKVDIEILEDAANKDA